MSLVIGRVTINGTDPQNAVVKQALAEVKNTPPLETLLTHNYSVTFVAAAQMPKIPGTTSPAYGFTLPTGHALELNAYTVSSRPFKAKHVARHEIWHGIQDDLLTPAKKQAIKPLLRKRDGTVPTLWRGGAYPDHCSEIVADGLAAYCAGVDSPFDGYYGTITDPAQVATLLLAADPAPVDPPEPPDPTPAPDPDTAAIQAALDAANAKIAAAKEALQ